MNQEFVQALRAKGLYNHQVLAHVIKNAAPTVLAVIGLQLGYLMGGSILVETVFSWPGIGLLTIESIQSRDYPVVQACVLLISVTYVLVNLLTDIAYAWIDPRIRLGATA